MEKSNTTISVTQKVWKHINQNRDYSDEKHTEVLERLLGLNPLEDDENDKEDNEDEETQEERASLRPNQ